jgi:PAS domain S-box-containing protein
MSDVHLRDFVENANIGLHRVGSDGTILWANRAERELLGYEESEYIGKPITDFHVDRDVIDDILARLGRGEALHDYEARLRAKDGSIKHVLISSSAYFVDGQFIHTRCFTQDITERRRAEEALREHERFREAASVRAQRLLTVTAAIADAVSSEQVFEALVDRLGETVGASSVGLWLLEDGSSTARLARTKGYEAGTAQRLETLVLDQVPSVPVQDAIRLGEPVWFASRAEMLERYPHLGSLSTDGRSYRISCLPLFAEGRIVGAIGLTIEEELVASDEERDFLVVVARHAGQSIERLRLLEAERRSRAEANAARSRAEEAVRTLEETLHYNELFAGVLAHDLRNPLTAIMTSAQILVRRRDAHGATGDRDDTTLTRILSSGQRMDRMIDQLLDFTKARSGGGIEVAPRASDLDELCAQAVGEIELAHPDWNIDSKAVGDQTGTWDPERLLQLISNLVSNAGQHGTPGASIRAELDGTHPDEVRFEIHNEGVIPPALLPTIFDPFLTTRHPRAQSRGLGLGLFIVREIARAHGGSVDVSSSEGVGTTFSIRLPRRGTRPEDARA